VTVGGYTRFACVNGPDFDGHDVDFDELVSRMRYYTPQEKIAMVLRERGVL
jgi:ferredoxin--NADP+ reductase